MTKKPSKPRIITLTVKRLRLHAKWLRDRDAFYERAAADVDTWADELDAYDARETRKDPSQRKRR